MLNAHAGGVANYGGSNGHRYMGAALLKFNHTLHYKFLVKLMGLISAVLYRNYISIANIVYVICNKGMVQANNIVEVRGRGLVNNAFNLEMSIKVQNWNLTLCT